MSRHGDHGFSQRGSALSSCFAPQPARWPSSSSASGGVTNFATRRGILGMAARWNGRQHRRRPPLISPCFPTCTARSPIGGSSSGQSRPRSCRQSPSMNRSRCREIARLDSSRRSSPPSPASRLFGTSGGWWASAWSGPLRCSCGSHGATSWSIQFRRRRLPGSTGRGRAWLSAGGIGVGRVDATGHGEGGPASKRVIVGFGFWIFLLSDIVMFSAFFAAHAVLQTATAGGPAGRDLFNWWSIVLQTACLLTSSFTCGLSAVATEARNQVWTQLALLVTGVLGLAFLMLEARDFTGMVMQGAGPQRSAFLSSLFAVVGLHGLHVSAGLLWLGTMMAQVFVKGFRPDILRRLVCFNLFWHALDIIWVALFTIVYLIGLGR